MSGRDVKCPDAHEMMYTIKERQYFEHIDKAYNYASKLLLDLLMQELDLMARLRSVSGPCCSCESTGSSAVTE